MKKETVCKIMEQCGKILKYQEDIVTVERVIPCYTGNRALLIKERAPDRIKINGKNIVVIIKGRLRKYSKCGETSHIKKNVQ